MTFHKITTLKTEKSEISPNFQTLSQKLSILSFSTQFIGEIPLSQNQLKNKFPPMRILNKWRSKRIKACEERYSPRNLAYLSNAE